MFDTKGRFIMKDYTRQSTFASFLPGISGKYGIPIWCFYVNRGQGVASFGVKDKEHSIMEFYPARQAYEVTSQVGFRTFLKVDGTYFEPFGDENFTKDMYIGMNEFEIEENCKASGIKTNVLYFTLPGEKLGGLIRKITFTNISNQKKEIEFLDGMAAVVTYGTGLMAIKAMGETSKAWMQVEDVEEKKPYYRVRVSTDDSAEVSEVKEGNFYLSYDEQGTLLPVIVDPYLIFEYDTAKKKAIGFKETAIEELFKKEQVTQNNVPCAFVGKRISLDVGESCTFYAVIGEASEKTILHDFAIECSKANYFETKYEEANYLTEKLCKAINTKTGNKVFDEYCKQTYLDNILRGGHPILSGDKKLGDEKIFYLYSRKHGDIERDYNFFSMSPEFYSQGNANFRDVNQNRRCDVLFAPFIKDYNIKAFYNLIQLDGYNPLAVEQMSYHVEKENLSKLMHLVNTENEGAFNKLLSKSFTPGSLLSFLQKTQATSNRLTEEVNEQVLKEVLSVAKEDMNARFGEGYWSDHWTYNLDLVESYLMVYPEEEKTLIFDDMSYTYFESKALVQPRNKRYVLTEKGPRQYHAVEEETKANVAHKVVRMKYGEGEVYHSNLMCKLILINTLKFATLDAYGMGVEMEGGKPGWYDALNGLPGIFGSSMCETYELCRTLEFTVQKLKVYQVEQALPKELAELIVSVNNILEETVIIEDEKERSFVRWDRINNAKEQYRQRTRFGIDGTLITLSSEQLVTILSVFLKHVKQGIAKAIEYGDGLCPTYFTYELTEYEETEKGLIAKAFEVIPLPYFLEGPVRYMKLDTSLEEKKVMYDKIKSSALYDKALKMYKVNSSLEKTSYEVGRARAFTPGWLENESIWLHMEYKYLLELLKAGLYKEFFEDFKTQCIPFLDPAVYGRSPLENSSFIVSSANPNPRIHGKGFVARLSGSTAEFIHMWQLMMFGKKPFVLEDGELMLHFKPCLPKYLIDERLQIECTFLGRTKVIYHLSEANDFIPDRYNIGVIWLTNQEGKTKGYQTDELRGEVAEAVRSGKIIKIEVELQR